MPYVHVKLNVRTALHIAKIDEHFMSKFTVWSRTFLKNAKHLCRMNFYKSMYCFQETQSEIFFLKTANLFILRYQNKIKADQW